MTRDGALPGRNPGTRALREESRVMRSISASTTSCGISTRKFLRVSFTSTISVFMMNDSGELLTRYQRVRKGGVEPPKPFGYRILSPARLPNSATFARRQRLLCYRLRQEICQFRRGRRQSILQSQEVLFEQVPTQKGSRQTRARDNHVEDELSRQR